MTKPNYSRVLLQDSVRWAFWCKMTPSLRRNRDDTVTLIFPCWPSPPLRGYYESSAATIDQAIDQAMEQFDRLEAEATL